MRFLLAGGGTGGHIYPALAIAGELRRRRPEVQLLYLGTQEGMEARVVPEAGIDFVPVPSGRILGKRFLSKAAGIWQALRGVATAGRLIREFRPDAAVGTGGYASGPAMLAAALQGVPVIIQEQNVYPGLTNRLLAHLAEEILVPHPKAAEAFGPLVKGKVLAVGNPVRPEIIKVGRKEGANFFALDPNRPVLLLYGGSGGAKRLNQAAAALLPRVEKGEYQLIWATGAAYYEEAKIIAEPYAKTEGLRLTPYLEQMAKALAAADLVVARAGAMALAEITVRGLPVILVPSPNVVYNHQELNARVLEGGGAAVVLADGGLTGEMLDETVMAILGDRRRLERMGASSLALGRPEALGEIVTLILASAGQK